MTSRYLARALAVVLVAGVGAEMGLILFSDLSGALRGAVLTLLVLAPVLLTELLKDRPTTPRRR